MARVLPPLRGVEGLLPECRFEVSPETLRSLQMNVQQKFAVAHCHAFNQPERERSLSSGPIFKADRATARAELRGLCRAPGTARLSW